MLRTRTLGVLPILLLLALAGEPVASAEAPPGAIGSQVENFTLLDYLGAEHSLDQWSDKRAIVVVFIGCECPLAKLYGPRLVELAQEYEPQDVTLVAINANVQDTLKEIAAYARRHKIDFPILKDPSGHVADQLGATRTPEAIVLDQHHRVRYRGRIDDQYGVGYARVKVVQNDLANALDELLAGKPVQVPVTKAVGCFIGRAQEKEPVGEITYTKDIAAIFNRRCVRCHREGEIAPFALDSYDEIVGWGETLVEVLEDGRMPPWHANPQHGEFANDAQMPDEEKQRVYRWVENGAPRGDADDLPEPPTFVEGWQIPEPDVVFRMPEAFQVPAKGVVPYQYFELDPGFTEDKWVQAAEARPGNRQVTHHLILFYHPPGKDRLGPEEALFNSVASFAPGLPPAIYAPGTARRIPAGSKLVFQVHYTPNGSPQADLSLAGLVFADPAKVQKEVSVGAAINWRFRIPPGADAHRVVAEHSFGQDALLTALVPHMHLRGKSFRFEAIYPSGDREVLLDVPRYDFNWQNTYVLAKPKLMPHGARLHCVALFDNSEANLVNPDPTAAVYWGDQTWEEMMIGSFATMLDEQDLRLGLPRTTRREDGRYDVLFRYRPSEQVRSVSLAGSFNEWKTDAQPMQGPDREGFYRTKLVLEAGTHEYKFVVDGEIWRADPGNPDFASYYNNSVLRVGE